MQANAVRHRAADPVQYAADVASMSERLAQLPRDDASLRAEREQALEANRHTPAGRSLNASAVQFSRLPEQEKQRRMAAVRAAYTPEEQAAAVASAPPCAHKKTATGIAGVYLNNSATNPYKATVSLDGKQVRLGSFATADEAAQCIAQLPKPARKVAPKVAPKVEASAEPTAGTRSNAPPLPLTAVVAAPALLLKLAQCLKAAELSELLR